MSDDAARFEPAEERAIREAFAGGTTPTCPRDNTLMTVRSIGGGSFGLGYARRREWLICPYRLRVSRTRWAPGDPMHWQIARAGRSCAAASRRLPS